LINNKYLFYEDDTTMSCYQYTVEDNRVTFRDITKVSLPWQHDLDRYGMS